MLEIMNLTVMYGAAYALKGVSLNVQSGEFVSIIGANGAGKTTLLRAISGLLPIQSGNIIFNGEKINDMEPKEIVRRGIIQVPEDRKLVGTASVLDNLKLGAYLQWKLIKDKLELVYKMFPVLKQKEKQQARTLSGGEQQMVAIARALMGNPKLLLLDEVTFGLAPVVVHLMRSKLEKLHQLGISILLAEQNAQLALAVSQRSYLIEYGRVRNEGLTSDLRENPDIKAAYLGL